MCQCPIKEKKSKSTSTDWRNSTKSEPRLEFSAPLCLLSFSVCRMSLDLHLLNTALSCLSLPFSLCPLAKTFTWYLLDRIAGEGMSNTLAKRDKVTNSSCPQPPQIRNKQRLSSSVHMLSLTFIVDIHFTRRLSTHSVFAWYTVIAYTDTHAVFEDSGMEEYLIL